MSKCNTIGGSVDRPWDGGCLRLQQPLSPEIAREAALAVFHRWRRSFPDSYLVRKRELSKKRDPNLSGISLSQCSLFCTSNSNSSNRKASNSRTVAGGSTRIARESLRSYQSGRMRQHGVPGGGKRFRHGKRKYMRFRSNGYVASRAWFCTVQPFFVL